MIQPYRAVKARDSAIDFYRHLNQFKVNPRLAAPESAVFPSDTQCLKMDSPKFVDDSVLDILVPQDSDYDIEQLIESANSSEHAETGVCRLFPFIATRKILHFDESISICVVLRTPYFDEIQLNSYISRLIIRVEAHAFSSSSPSKEQEGSKDQSPSQSRDIIWFSIVNTAEEPLIIVQQKDSQDENPHFYIVWKVSAYLSRPRFRLQSPMIIFKPSAVLRPAQLHDIGHSNDQYLPSGIPASLNIFESLNGDRVLQGIEPRLSALRLSPFGSTALSSKSTKSALKSLLPAAFRAIPALSAKVRYSTSIGHAGMSTLIASLEIETAPYFDNDVIVTSIGMQLSEGSAQDLSIGSGFNLPLRCRPKDNPIFLYRLIPTERNLDWVNTGSTSRILEITVDAKVVVSDRCTPRIEMRWKTGVDFSIALNPNYGAPGQSLQRNKRPASLPVAPATPSSINPSTLTQEREFASFVSKPMRQRAVSASNLGITITFTAPSEVRVGQPFSWDVFILNKSSKPQKLVITVIPKRKRGDPKGHLSKSSSSSVGGHKGNGNADVIMDDNLLYAVQRNVGNDCPQIVALSTEVKIGPLNPGFCFNSSLKFLPLAQGVLHIEAIRVIDMASDQSIDIQDLPDIIAVEGLNDE